MNRENQDRQRPQALLKTLEVPVCFNCVPLSEKIRVDTSIIICLFVNYNLYNSMS